MPSQTRPTPTLSRTRSGGFKGFGSIVLTCAYDESIVAKIRRMPGAKFVRQNKTWTFYPHPGTANQLMNIFPDATTDDNFKNLLT